jgi:hypothetical protein
LLATELPDPHLVNALDKDAADYGARNGSVAKTLEHDRLDLGGRRVEDRVSDLVPREDGPDLPAIWTPRGVIHDDAFAAPGLGGDRKAEQRCRSGRYDRARVIHNGSASRHCFPTRDCLLSPHPGHSAACRR